MAVELEEGSIDSWTDSAGNDDDDDDDDGEHGRMLLEQSLEMQSDMVEHVAMIDRARHLEVFEQLRTLQAQQREQLLRDQQSQWSRLQEGQRVTEARLLAQRQNQWGSKTSPLPTARSVKELSPPSQQRGTKMSTGLPQAIAASTLALARIRLQESLLASDSVQSVVRGRPVPQFIESVTPEHAESVTDEPDNYTDVSDSSAESMAQENQSIDDGVYPLPDSASETSELHGSVHAVLAQKVQTQKAKSIATAPQSLPADAFTIRSKLYQNTEENIQSDRSALTAVQNGIAVSESQHVSLLNAVVGIVSPTGDSEPDSGVPSSFSGSIDVKKFENYETKNNRLASSNCSMAAMNSSRSRDLGKLLAVDKHKVVDDSTMRRKYDESHLKDEDGGTSSEIEQEEDTEKPPTMQVATHDDLPVGGGMVRGKTFEQMIEEQLKVEQQQQPVKHQLSDAARKYLRRGEGAVRSSKPPLQQSQKPVTGKRNRVSSPSKGQPLSHRTSAQIGQPKSSTPAKNKVAPTSNESFGETSFIARMQKHAKRDEIEVRELQEFELLEQFVDDNASLISDISINKILPLARNNVKLRSNGNQKTSGSHVRSSAKETIHLATHRVKNVESSSESEESGDSDVENTTLIDGEPESVVDSCSADRDRGMGEQSTALKSIYRKILSRRTPGSDSSETMSCQQSIETVKKNEKSPTRCKSIISSCSDNSPSDSSSDREDYDDDIHLNPREVVDAVMKDVPAISRSISGSVPFDSVVNSANEKWGKASSDVEVKFNDDEEWPEVSIVGTSIAPHGDNSKLQDHMSKESPSSPPVSKLAAKLFPSLKPRVAVNSNKSASQTADTAVSSNASVEYSNQSAAVRQKLAQLEAEIQHFRDENAALTRIRKEQEQIVERLKKEMAEFEKQKGDELKRLEDFKTEEKKKIRKQYKVFEKYQQAIKAAPDKKEREEIEALKLQLSKLQEEMQKREQRLTANTTRLKDRLEQVELENSELKQEIRILEQYRLENWKPKKTETDSASQFPKPINSETLPKLNGDSQTVKTTSSAKLKGNEYGVPVVSAAAVPAIQPTVLPFSQSTVLRNSSPLSLSGQGDGPLGPSTKTFARKTAPIPSGNVESKLNELNQQPYDELKHPDGKVERICSDGSHEILFANGTRKQISADGKTIIVSFFNGDIKQILGDGRVVYYYADAKTTHTTYTDGLQIFQFANQQIEKHYIDGTKEIQFPDQTIKYLFPDGSSESVFPDGTVIRVEKNEDKVMTFANGQKEIHTKQFRRREYPDGTTKTIFVDGRQETRYSNGRLRVKDANGCLILDQLR